MQNPAWRELKKPFAKGLKKGEKREAREDSEMVAYSGHAELFPKWKINEKY